MGEALKARGEARASTDRADLLTNTRLRARARSACFVGGGSFFENMDGAACCLDGCQSSMSIRITPFPNCPPPRFSQGCGCVKGPGHHFGCPATARVRKLVSVASRSTNPQTPPTPLQSTPPRPKKSRGPQQTAMPACVCSPSRAALLLRKIDPHSSFAQAQAQRAAPPARRVSKRQRRQRRRKAKLGGPNRPPERAAKHSCSCGPASSTWLATHVRAGRPTEPFGARRWPLGAVGRSSGPGGNLFGGSVGQIQPWNRHVLARHVRVCSSPRRAQAGGRPPRAGSRSPACTCVIRPLTPTPCPRITTTHRTPRCRRRNRVNAQGCGVVGGGGQFQVVREPAASSTPTAAAPKAGQGTGIPALILAAGCTRTSIGTSGAPPSSSRRRPLVRSRAKAGRARSAVGYLGALASSKQQHGAADDEPAAAQGGGVRGEGGGE